MGWTDQALPWGGGPSGAGSGHRGDVVSQAQVVWSWRGPKGDQVAILVWGCIEAESGGSGFDSGVDDGAIF